MVALFVVAGLPVAAVVWLVIGPVVAVLYLLGQTAFLTYGLRRRHVATLRLSPEGISYEPGRFQLKCSWSDADSIEKVQLPDGTAEALRLGRPRLHWVADPSLRSELTAKGWDTVVPLSPFDPDWRHGPIGDAIRRWHPRLPF